MKNRNLIVFLLLLFFSDLLSGQKVYIDNKIFEVNGCPIYFNGANTPWDNWNDFGGSYDANFWATHFATLNANGINASRVWISCNGDVQPNINIDGTVTGASTQFWDNCDHFFQQAQANGIYIMATMMSFDHTKNTYTKYTRWRNMLNDVNKMQSYIDNYLIPFVNRYKENPYLMSIDLCNEPEWIAENSDNMQCSYAVLQNFFARSASAIHNNPRADGSTVLVTIGSAATKWNATRMRIGSNGAWSQNNSDGNKWSDVALKAQYNQPNAIIDFYSPHYYAWVDQWYSNPYVRTPTDFGMNEKACLIGETPGGNPGTPNMTALASYEALKANGYQGHFPWTSNGVDSYGGISNFASAAQTFSDNYPDLVFPPVSGCGSLPVTMEEFHASVSNENVLLKWTTFLEINNAEFTILSSKDAILWEEIGVVKGKGNSSDPTHYSFIDNAFAGGVVYYKLRQTDLDGRYSESNPIRVSIDPEMVVKVFPNPLLHGEILSWQYHSEEPQDIVVRLFQVTGECIFQKSFELVKGMNVIELIFQDLGSGVYTIVWEGKGFAGRNMLSVYE